MRRRWRSGRTLGSEVNERQARIEFVRAGAIAALAKAGLAQTDQHMQEAQMAVDACCGRTRRGTIRRCSTLTAAIGWSSGSGCTARRLPSLGAERRRPLSRVVRRLEGRRGNDLPLAQGASGSEYDGWPCG